MKRPNILHLFTDQQRFDTIHALGNDWIQTPNIDWLVENGCTYGSAYAPCAECVPSRASMITGMYADRVGCGSNADQMPPEETPTLMSELSRAGYRTHGVGKCHFTPDFWAMRGFQSRDTCEEIAEHAEGDDYLDFLKDAGLDYVLEPHGIRGEMYYIPQPSQLPAEKHPTHWVGDRCLEFIESTDGKDEPWYLYAGFIHPHPPFAPPNPWHKLYRGPEMPLPYLPEEADDLLCFINRFQNRYKYRDRGVDLNMVRCMRAYYAACISFVDYQVGRILECLRSRGQLENTMIVYSSDHGELLGDFNCFGKRSFHDVSLRVPLVVSYPGALDARSKCEDPVSLVDLMPTFLNAAGAPIPECVDGVDLVDVAQGNVFRDCIFFHYSKGPDALVGACDHTHKYVWSAPDQKEFLFDRTESFETRNLAEDPREQTILEALRLKVQSRAREHAFGRLCLSEDGQSWKSEPQRQMPKALDAGLLFQDPPLAKATLPDGYRLNFPRENFPDFGSGVDCN